MRAGVNNLSKKKMLIAISKYSLKKKIFKDDERVCV